MKQVVCLKITPKIEQLRFDEAKKTMIRDGVENEINEVDKNALEASLSLKDKMGGEVVVLSMGPPSFDPFLKLAIAMGADDAVLLSDRAFAGADTYSTSRVLSSAIRRISNVDLILCSEASSDGSTEQVPPSIAAWLGVPLISYVSSMSVNDHKLRAKRVIRGGYEVVETELPALASIQLGCNTPRFPDFRRKRWAEKEFKTKVWGISDIGQSPTEVGLEGSMTSVNELKSMRSPERKKEFLTGEPKQIAERLAELVRKS